ncbi:unnamed protein product [Haemonchus placei]|uniref:CCT domain-containing protein n=1 Tax=Haemonchus placei TaxID=6290 RepID=A0A0N4X287_HAEPC|nr:unnamed protein product [Haemonchus placei]
MQLHSDQTVAYHRNRRLTQDGKHQTVDMEAVFESVLEDASRAVENGSDTAQMQLSEVELEGSKQQSVPQPQQIITQASVENGFTAVHQSAQLMNSSKSYEQQQPVGYSEDIEDLMAVLRDDQDDGLRHGSIQMDLGVGYGSEELADLLGEDWLDCADRSITNNGHHIPYKNESHDEKLVARAQPKFYYALSGLDPACQEGSEMS